MRFSDSLANLADALSKAQAEIKNPLKTATNAGVQGSPKYATLEDTLSDYVRPVLSKHGIAVFQSLNTNEKGQVGVQTTLLHKSGEFIEGDYIYCDVVIPISNKGNKVLTEGQATGVCITYLRRYSLNAAVGITGDADTDGSYGEKEEEPLTFESAKNYEITFGKHAGKKLAQLYHDDMEYVKWLLQNDRTDARLKEAIALLNTAVAQSKKKSADAEKWKVEGEKQDA